MSNEPTVESPIHEQSFWGSNTNAGQQDWVGYLGLDATDDQTSVPSEGALTEEPVELTHPPVTAAPDDPDVYAALAAPNDDLLPQR